MLSVDNIIENWNKTFSSTGTINKILSDPHTTIEEILDDDDFITELRSGNEKLTTFLTHEKLETMIRYIIEEPTFDDDYKRCYKYPFISCEAFCSDTEFVFQKMLDRSNDYALLQKLFKLLEKKEINVTLAGYFNKVLSFLMLKRPDMAFDFFNTKKELLYRIVDFAHLTSMSDLLVRFFSLITTKEIEDYFNLREALYDKIIGTLTNPGTDEDVVCEIFDVMTVLTRRIYTMKNAKEIMQYFMQKYFGVIVEYLFSSSSSAVQIQNHGFTFLSSFIENLFIREPKEVIHEDLEANFGFQLAGEENIDKKHEEKSEKPESEPNAAASKPPMNEMGDVAKIIELEKKLAEKSQKLFNRKTDAVFVCEAILNSFDKFAALIKIEDADCKGRVGLHKMRLLEMLKAIIELDNKNLNNLVVASSLLHKIKELFFAHEHHSILHATLHTLISAIIRQEKEDLLRDLFTKAQFLSEAFARVQISLQNNEGQNKRKSYMALLYKIFKELSIGYEDKDEKVIKLVEEYSKHWEDVALPFIESEESMMNKELGTSVFEYKFEEVKDTVVDHTMDEKPHGMNKDLIDNDVGARSTTKNIVERSIGVNTRLMNLATNH